MLQLTLEAIKAAEARDGLSFCVCWVKNDSQFSRIKLQYERMLNYIPLDKAEKWKKSLKIDDGMNNIESE